MQPEKTPAPKNQSFILRGIAVCLLVILAIALLAKIVSRTASSGTTGQNTLSLSETHPAVDSSAPSDSSWFFSIIRKPAPAQSIPAQQQPTPTENPLSSYTPAPEPTPISPSPVITSLSATDFGNGDTITIYGKNFTKNNEVLLSFEFPGTFTNIPSTDGTSISFTVRATTSTHLAGTLSSLAPAEKQTLIAQIAANELKLSGQTGSWRLPATIAVQNQNGTSAKIPVRVNMLAGI